MKYIAKIDYTGNIEKAGKLTLIGEDNSVILSKVPVAIPGKVFDGSILFNKIYSTVPVQIELDESLLEFEQNGEYKSVYKKLTEKNVYGFFIKSFSKILIKPTTDFRMHDDNDAFVMHKEHFDVLFELLCKRNILELETKKVSFLWFPEKVLHTSDEVNMDLLKFEYLETHIKNEKTAAEKMKALEIAQKKAKLNATNKPKLDDAISNISKIVEQENKNIFKPEIKKTDFNLRKVNQNNSSDDLDGLDIMLMYSNPELAPFMKPNSSLAWYLYFNSRDNINKSYVEENIQNVPGFEDIGASEFKYTPKGYSVTLFADEYKNNEVGRIEFDSQRNCYQVNSNNGESTLLTVEDNGQIKSCFQSSNMKVDMNLVKSNDGFIGNWETNQNGINVKSSIVIDDNFEYNSSPGKTIDLSRVEYEPVNDYSSKVGRSFTEEKEYTPPPPPPKMNDTWSSSDPYSNSSSFKM